MDELKARAAFADHERRERLNRRLRQAFIEGAEEDSRRRLGRGLTREELAAGAAALPRRCRAAPRA